MHGRRSIWVRHPTWLVPVPEHLARDATEAVAINGDAHGARAGAIDFTDMVALDVARGENCTAPKRCRAPKPRPLHRTQTQSQCAGLERSAAASFACHGAIAGPRFAKRGSRAQPSTEFPRTARRAVCDFCHGIRMHSNDMLGEETFHPDTRALLAYGRALAGSAAPPKKGGADQVLERLFVVERTNDGRMPLRTFGAELINLFGRDMRDHDFARFFLEPDLGLVRALIEACAAAGEPGIVRVTAETHGTRVLGAEILLTPLKVDANVSNRFLGLFQSLGGDAFIGDEPIYRLRVGSVHPPTAKEPKAMRLVVVND